MAYYRDSRNTIHAICGLTVALLVSNMQCDTGQRIQSLLRAYAFKIEEYYGYFKSFRPFLCFYCNKSLATPHGLRQHLRDSHEARRDGAEYEAVNSIEYICYLMLLQTLKIFHKMKDKESQWFPDEALSEYINAINTVSLHFTMNGATSTDPECIIKKVHESSIETQSFLSCDGKSACYNASVLSNGSVLCGGKYGCAWSPQLTSTWSYGIHCDGMMSCAHSHIQHSGVKCIALSIDLCLTQWVSR